MISKPPKTQGNSRKLSRRSVWNYRSENAKRRTPSEDPRPNAVIPKNPLKVDPTRTIVLRKRYAADINRRFKRLRKEILDLLLLEDALGLKRRNQVDRPTLLPDREIGGEHLLGERVRTNALSSNPLRLHGQRVPRNVANTRWRFLSDPQKAAAFRAWLETAIENNILSTSGAVLDPTRPWLGSYVEEAYGKGMGHAFDAVRNPDLAKSVDFFEGTRQEFLRQSFAQPVALEKVELIAGRTFSDLRGITSRMSAAISDELTRGMIQGRGPRETARLIAKQVDISKARALTISRTETIRAHAEGNLDAMERLGVTEIGVAVEWSTSKDERVCPLCQPLEGVVLKLSEARGMFPRHPNCRCSPIPANVGEPSRGQKATKSRIKAAIDKSVKAEIPKRQRKRRSVATQKKRSPWVGAGKPISKKRPESIV